MTLSAEDRARRIKVLIFDVDGVLTDGQLYFLPQTNPDGKQYGLEFKGFTAHDGLGITLARIGGLRIGLITKRESATVAIRARDLKLEFVYQGQSHKLAAAEEIASKAGITMDELRPQLDRKRNARIVVGQHTSADPVTGLEHEHRAPVGTELASGLEPGRARAHDDHVGPSRR